MRKRKISIYGAVFILGLLLLLAIQPAVMAQDEITEVKVSYYRIPYGTGQDTSGDGVIDSWNDPQVTYGDVNISDLEPLTDGWYKEFKYFGTTLVNRNDYGYSICGYHEELWEIESSSNESINPTTICYTHNKIEIETVTNVLGVASFYIKLSPNDLLTGAQEFWYRSPIAWDPSKYAVTPHQTHPFSTPEHYLNIYDEDNNLLWASPKPSIFIGNPYPRNMSDDSTTGYPYERIYYKIAMPLRPNTRYRFEEYVKTIDNNPINSVLLYMARLQDIGNDGETSTYIFKGSPHSRLITVECSWSMLITMGIGLAGTERIIFSGGPRKPVLDFRNYVLEGVYVQDIAPGEEVESITIIFPLRTTKPLDLKVRATTWAGVSEWQSDWILYEDIMGIAVLDMSVTDPNKNIPTKYTFEIIIDNFDEGVGDAMTYTMFDGNPSNFHIVYNNSGIQNNEEVLFFSPLIEIREHLTDIGTQTSGAEKDFWLLEFFRIVGGALAAAGIMLLIMQAPFIIGATFLGIGTIMATYGMLKQDWSIAEDALKWLWSGLVRVLTIVYDGINYITGGLLDITVRVVETIVHAGAWVIRNAGAILAAIVDIIYFLTAFLVWWLTAKFLAIMTAIRKGQIDQAGRQIVRIEGVTRKRLRQVRRPIKKTRKRIVKAVRR